VLLAETDEEAGTMEHTAVAGAPVQASDTVPLKDVPEIKLRR
jgi:hypothetical protein